MSKTVIVWLAIYVSGLLASLARGPIFALLIYMFTFYTHFGWAEEIAHHRLSMYAACSILIAYILHYNNLTRTAYLTAPPMKWLLLFLVNMLFVTPFAVDPVHNQKTIEFFIKLIVLYFLIVHTIRTVKEYKWFIWLQIWGNYLFGWQGYQEGSTGGRLEGIGGPSTNTSNSLANHMLVIIPFINNLFFQGNKWEKMAAIWAAPFILNAIILCNSRGAFLGLLAMIALMFLRAPAQIRKKYLIGFILGGILFFYLTNETFWNRMFTIDDYGKDRSSSRIVTWTGAVEMIKDYPWGRGGDSFLYYSPVYIPEIVAAHGGKARSVHNSYLQVATNYGLQGLFFYLMFIFSTFRILRKTKKMCTHDKDENMVSECTAIEIGLAGFLIAAIFGARPYSEVLYWFSALACVLYNIKSNEIYTLQQTETDA